MTTRVSSKGQIVLPAGLRRKLSILAGDALTITIESTGPHEDRVVLTRKRKARARMKIITDPITGWPVAKLPPGTPKVTSAMVKEILADFP